MLDAGQKIDRYVVDSVIGYGGTAVVYRVKHVQLATDHALKVLSVSSTAIRERMLREGRVQAALTHPNVVALSDVLDVNGAPGLLMEYIEGPSLEEALKQFRISIDDAEMLFHGIVLGVQAAHETGLVHRDLKPANVLLAETEEGFVPKVTDFGLAKVLVGDGIEVGTTRAGIAMGTPSYMSPEQIRDAREVDQRADVFSLGCLLYELVTGQRTFPGDQALTIYNAITAGEYLPAQQLVPDLPNRIVQCVDGCLALDRDERIPDCATVLEVLSGQREWKTSSHPVPTEAIVERLHDDIPLMQVAGPFVDDDLTAGEPLEDENSSEVKTAAAPVRRYRKRVLMGLLTVFLFLILVLGVGTLWAVKQVFTPIPGAIQASTAVESLPFIVEPVVVIEEPAVVIEEPAVVIEEPVVADTEVDVPVVEPVALDAALEPPSPTAVLPSAIRSHRPTAARKFVGVKAVPLEVKLLSVPPNAALVVDGKEQGRTNKKMEMMSGTHRVIVRSGEKEGSFKIGVKEGRPNKWCYDFATETVVNSSCSKR